MTSENNTPMYNTEADQGEIYLSIAVVIPTYNRWDCLESTLQALLGQDHLPDEVIVVNDGSTDDSWQNLQKWEKGHDCPFRFVIFTQENSGPAKARNLGVKNATSDLVAFLGDDTIPQCDWVRQHFDKQNELGGGSAVVGYTGWDAANMRVTPFLKYINGRGAQFKYDFMEDGSEVPFYCFYTSNLSLPRKYLLAEPFNEIFKLAGWEDAEVGYRLSLQKMRIIYHKAAITRHRHQTTLATFMKRQFLVGRTCHLLLKLHPELTDIYYYKDSPMLKCYIGIGYAGRLFFPLIRLLDYCHIPLPRIVYLFYLGWHYVRGLRSVPL